MIYLPPFAKTATVPVSSRRTYVSGRIDGPFVIDKIRIAFRFNTQNYLQVSAWVIGAPSVLDDTRPAGINLLSGLGGDDYIVGAGNEGEIVIPIGRRFDGQYVAWEAYNTDTSNTHTLNARFDLYREE